MSLAAVACALFDIALRATLPESALVNRNEGARAYLGTVDPPDIQVIGDSVALRGLLASALGTDSVYVRNDALASARPPTSYYLLKRQFEQGRIPEAIILAHTPVSFDDAFTARLTATFASWSEIPEIYAMASQWTEVLFGTLARISYVLMNRAQIRDLLLRGDTDFFLTPESESEFQPAQDTLRLRAYPSVTTLPRGPDDPSDENPRLTALAEFRVIEESDAYFRKILALAAEHGVKVFWMTMPVPAVVQQARRATSFDRDLLTYLQQFERSGLLTILEAGPLVYDDSMFDDPVHPNMHAAVRFSCAMRTHARVLAQAVAGRPDAGQGGRTAARIAALEEQRQARDLLNSLCESRSSASYSE